MSEQDSSDIDNNSKSIDQDDSASQSESNVTTEVTAEIGGAEEEEEADEEEEEEEEEEAGEEDEAENEDLDEDDDDEHARLGKLRGQKKSRRRNLAIFDEEADDDDDDEPSDDDDEADDLEDLETLLQDDDVDDGGGASQRRLLAKQRYQDDEGLMDLTPDVLEKHLKERYDSIIAEEAELSQEDLLPTEKDPRLWMVSCVRGKERDVIISLTHKFYNTALRGIDEQVRITGAIAPPHLKGFVYIEARKEVHVRAAIQNIPFVYQRTLVLIPIEQMLDCVRILPKHVPKVNDWVRVKSGLYKDDIGQVLAVDQVRDQVEVKLIPRLDYETIRSDAESRAEALRNGQKAPPKRRISALHRPPRRHFSPEEARLANSDAYASIQNGHKFAGSIYSTAGFLHKKFNMNSLDFNDIQPSLDDIQRFSRQEGEEGATAGVQSLKSALAQLKPKRRVIYTHGDHVELAVGDLKGLKGVVTRVDGEKIELRPLSTDVLFNEVLSVHVSEIVKYFRVGNHVKVIAGHFEGETGMITNVENYIASIMTDIAPREIKVLCQDLQESPDVAVGLQSLAGYSLHDLVQIANMQVAVIIKITRDSFKVIDQNGLVSTLKVTDLNRKMRTRDATQQDSEKNLLRVDDAVRILNSPTLGGRTGIIIHIWKQWVFLRVREASETHGITVTRANNLILSGKNPNPHNAAAGSSLPPMSPGTARASRLPLPSFNPNYRRRSDDSRLGKLVRITRGNWKGYIGLCKDINGTTARVELQATAKTVTVDLNDTAAFNPDTVQSRPAGEFYPSDNHLAPPTPAAHLAPSTPSAYDSYYNPPTPGSGVESSYFTPSERIATPGIPTPQDQPWTQSWTPGYSVQTPSISPYPKTPSFGAPTPAVHTPNYTVPSTPGLPTTPHMQGPFTPYQVPAGISTAWLFEDILVKIIAGDAMGKTAVVKSFDAMASNVKVELLENRQILTLPFGSLSPAPVASKDKVICISGPERGSTGFVASILGDVAMVQIGEGRARICQIDVHELAPLH